MEEMARLIEEIGLRSEVLGPRQEWSPLPPKAYQRRHAAFWGVVDSMLSSEPGTYEELPDWMTEVATAQLLNN